MTYNPDVVRGGEHTESVGVGQEEHLDSNVISCDGTEASHQRSLENEMANETKNSIF